MSDNNLKILGLGAVGAGDYAKVTINGSGNITGEINAESITVNGAAKSSENVSAGEIEINGTFSGKSVKARKMTVRGLADFAGTVECEEFNLNGSIKCNTINAEQVDIRMKGFVNVDELVGTKISVRVSEPTLIIMNIQIKPSVLRARLIEADEIYLENTEADVVSGNIVHIGRGCRIGRVEYQESLKVSDCASVDQIVKE